MDIIFLGTSSGTPTKTRNVSGIAVLESCGSDWYLVDCGEATQHQLLHTSLSLNSLSGIFITHVHGDHCYGLPGVLASAGMHGRSKPLKIIAPKGIKEWFEATQLQTQLYLPYDIVFISSDKLPCLELGQFTVSVTALSHRVPSFAYSFAETKVEPSLNIEKLKHMNIPQGPLWGMIKNGVDVEYQGQNIISREFINNENKPRKVVICGDNDNPQLLLDTCRDCQVLVHEATYTIDIAQKVGDHVGHSYAKLIAEFAESISIPNLVLTHFSPRYQSDVHVSPSITDISIEALYEYTGNLYLAEDFHRYRLEKSGNMKLVRQE